MNRPGPKTVYPVGRSRFIVSAVKPDQYPPADRPEVAFAGRSNVGKSSLLNRLLNRRKLARTGSTPGRTQTINFYDVNDELYFVDLPGFGYAKVPIGVRASWRPMVERYMASGRDLRQVVLLVDVRRDPGREEADLSIWLDGLGLSVLVVATKIDKVKRGKRHARLDAIRRGLGLADPPLEFSALTGEGRDAVWERLTQACGLSGPEE